MNKMLEAQVQLALEENKENLLEVKKNVDVEIASFKKIATEELFFCKRKSSWWGIFVEGRARKVKKFIVQAEIGCAYDDVHAWLVGLP